MKSAFPALHDYPRARASSLQKRQRRILAVFDGNLYRTLGGGEEGAGADVGIEGGLDHRFDFGGGIGHGIGHQNDWNS
jgi:hypothetical protein